MYQSPGPPKYLLLSVGEYIKKVWEVDPLSCPKCGNEMKIVSFINEVDVIRKILEHLGLWAGKTLLNAPLLI